MKIVYEVGDKVTIKSYKWYRQNRNRDGNIICGKNTFVRAMSKYCGEVFTIDRIHIPENKEPCYFFNGNEWVWNEYMFETPRIVNNVDLHSNTLVTAASQELIITIPEGYEFAGLDVVDGGNAVVLEKIKDYNEQEI